MNRTEPPSRTSTWADDIVRSPRGLAVLSELCGEDLDVWPRRLAGPIGDPAAHPFDTRHPALRVAVDDSEALAADVISAGSGYAWSPGGRVPREAVEARGPAFADAARALLGAPGARWWSEGVARDAQVVLGGAEMPPDVAARAADQFLMLGPAYYGRIPQVLTTSRRLGDRLPALELSNPDLDIPHGPVGCWAVQVRDDARVLEVHGPRDWQELLGCYPKRVPTTEDLREWGVTTDRAVVPDWEALARDWDGVHVSMLGLLTAQSVPLAVGGVHGVLEDVDFDLTAWFRPCLGEPELVATVAIDASPHAPPQA